MTAAVGLVIFLVVFFTVPRAPTFELATGDFFTSTDSSANYTTEPASLYFNANVKLLADTSSTYLGLSVHDFTVKVTDTATAIQIGQSSSAQSFHWAAHKRSTFDVPLAFAYTGGNSSDTTYGDITGACVANATETLALTLTITSRVRGLIGTKYRYLSFQGVDCPVTMSLV